jgi:hypothetical protein
MRKREYVYLQGSTGYYDYCLLFLALSLAKREEKKLIIAVR